ncbi:MAG: hypothetical protein QHC40_06280 [Sphingobium sp.]|nr:hypothetical protein [Sphingobium sp.]
MFEIAVTTPSPEGLTSAWMDTSPFMQQTGSMGAPVAGHGLGRKDDQPIEQVVSFVSRLMGPAALLGSIGVGLALIL